MFRHDKNMLHEIRIDRPNPAYAELLQEQLGGPNGELKAAMQYLSQSFRIQNKEIKDLFLDIASEELSHMEMVAEMINQLNGDRLQDQSARANLEPHTLTGLSPHLVNASGVPWTANYVNVTGDLVADLLSDIAAEQRAKVVYEYLYRQINDKGVKQTIDFLLNREEAHNALFREALNKVQNTGSNRDFGIDEDARLYFNLSKPGQYFSHPNPTPASFNNPSSNQPYQRPPVGPGH
jgi:Mn-containing catalase